MRFFIALLFALLVSAPAQAFNEFQGSNIQDVVEKTQKHGVTVEKLTKADVAKFEEATGPRPVADSDIYVLTLRSEVIVLLVVADGTIAFSSSPLPLAQFNKTLDRSNA